MQSLKLTRCRIHFVRLLSPELVTGPTSNVHVVVMWHSPRPQAFEKGLMEYGMMTATKKLAPASESAANTQDRVPVGAKA